MPNYKKMFQVSLVKTIYFNFKYFKLRDAVKFPVLIARRVKLAQTKGEIFLPLDIKTGMIQIGFHGVGIFDSRYSRAIWQVSGKVKFKGKCALGQGSKISVGKDGCLEIGDNFLITAESSIVCHHKIRFGNDVLISWDNLFMDTDFHHIYDNNQKKLNHNKEIIIGNHVWIGARNVILKGTELEDNCVLGGNSLINKSFKQQNVLLAGQPARILKTDLTWKI